MGTLVDLGRVRADRKLEGYIRGLEAGPAPPPEQFGWIADPSNDGVPISWTDAERGARIGVVRGRPDAVYLHYADEVRVWHDTTPGELAVGLESGVFPPPDEISS